MPMFQILVPIMTPSSKPSRLDSPSLQNQWGYYEVSWSKGPAIHCPTAAEALKLARKAGVWMPAIDGIQAKEEMWEYDPSAM